MKMTDLYKELFKLSETYKQKSSVTIAQKQFMDSFLNEVQNGVLDLSPTQNLIHASTAGLSEHVERNLLLLDTPAMREYLVEAKQKVLSYLEIKQNTLKRYGNVDAAIEGVRKLDYRLEKRIEKELRHEVRALAVSNREIAKAEHRAWKQKAEVKERLTGVVKRKEKKVRTLVSEVTSYKSEVEVKVKEVRELEITVKKVEEQRNTVKSTVDQYSAETKTLQQRVKELTSDYKKLERTYKSDIYKKDREISKVRKEAAAKDKEISAKDKEIKSLEKDYTGLEKRLESVEKKFEASKNKVKEQASTIRKHAGRAGYLEREYKKLEMEYSALEKKYEEDVTAVEASINVMEQSKTVLEATLKTSDDKIKQLEADNAGLKKENEQVKSLQDQLKESQDKYAELEGKYTAGDSQKAKDLEKENEDLKKQIEEHEQQHELTMGLFEELNAKYEKVLEKIVNAAPGVQEKPEDIPAGFEKYDNPLDAPGTFEKYDNPLDNPKEVSGGFDKYDNPLDQASVDFDKYDNPLDETPVKQDPPVEPSKEEKQEGIEEKVEDKKKTVVNVLNIDAMRDVHALVYSFSEHASVEDRRMVYEKFQHYWDNDHVIKAAVYNNLACIYSQVDNDLLKAKKYFEIAVNESERAAELELDISVDQLRDYRNNLFICEEKIRLKDRPSCVSKKQGIFNGLVNTLPFFGKKAV